MRMSTTSALEGAAGCRLWTRISMPAAATSANTAMVIRSVIVSDLDRHDPADDGVAGHDADAGEHQQRPTDRLLEHVPEVARREHVQKQRQGDRKQRDDPS